MVYELIIAGADIGEKNVVDISIGQHWSKYWTDNDLTSFFGDRNKYPHCYPDSHPQAKSNPQESSRLRHSVRIVNGCRTSTLRAANLAPTSSTR